ncbi:hypothetical protein Taro_014730 [Colocasia esculenta]|uniref:Transmembrane protein n=1 Tax=Colocasia esculenta TaxID=4460 RepID=A0A843UIX1_COLES|nr:hypothetical protein [Colocasia esculenta]
MLEFCRLFITAVLHSRLAYSLLFSHLCLVCSVLGEFPSEPVTSEAHPYSSQARARRRFLYRCPVRSRDVVVLAQLLQQCSFFFLQLYLLYLGTSVWYPSRGFGPFARDGLGSSTLLVVDGRVGGEFLTGGARRGGVRGRRDPFCAVQEGMGSLSEGPPPPLSCSRAVSFPSLRFIVGDLVFGFSLGVFLIGIDLVFGFSRVLVALPLRVALMAMA